MKQLHNIVAPLILFCLIRRSQENAMDSRCRNLCYLGKSR